MRNWFEHNGERFRSTVRDGVAAGAAVIGAIGGHRGDRFVPGDLRQQGQQHRRVTHCAIRELDCPDLERALVDGQMHLTPYAPLGPTMLARAPLPFASNLDASAVRCPAGSCEA